MMNKNTNIMNQINKLPNDVLNIIKEYLNYHSLVFLNKTYYDLYHYSIKEKITKYESYIRYIIKRDYYYVFNKVIRENFDNWIDIRKYRYKYMIFNSYIYFIMHFCMEECSEKCTKVLLNIFKERNFGKNLHKKKVVKYIKWIN